MRYEILSKGDEPAHVCSLPGLFAIWNQGLRAGAKIQCKECSQIWVRGNANFRWFQIPPPVEHIPKPPTGPGL